jgi:ABC-type branched-subunit amino acid transport system permease subunit
MLFSWQAAADALLNYRPSDRLPPASASRQAASAVASLSPAAIVVTAGFGALLALPALRVTGPYLEMVTLAFGTIIQILINEMTFLTEGPMGIKLSKPPLFGHKLDEQAFF